jgi:Tfp pilus assembly protein PilP
MNNKLIVKYILWASNIYKLPMCNGQIEVLYKHYLPIRYIYQLFTHYLLVIIITVSCNQNKPPKEYNNLKDIKSFIKKLEPKIKEAPEAFATKNLFPILSPKTLISNKDIFTTCPPNNQSLNPNNYNSAKLVGIIKIKGKYTGLVQFSNGSKTLETGQHNSDGDVVGIDASSVKIQKTIGQLKYTKLLLIGAST